MNLWVKHVGQTVFLLASALFFLSCEEDTSFLGYKADQRFNVYFEEIPIEALVYQFDSLITSNQYRQGETNRLLVGRYTDPAFGEVSASGITQFFRAGSIPDSLDVAVFDSITLQLSFDFYNYGSAGETSQEIAVYTIEKELTNVIDSVPIYHSNTEVPLGQQIGSTNFTVNPQRFEEYLNEGDTTLTIRFPLDFTYGETLFDLAKQFDAATDSLDSAFVRYPMFKQMFKGIAITPVAGDKIVGFSPGSSSKMVLHFHLNNNTKRDSIVFGFSGLASFSRIVADRSSSELTGLTQLYEPFTPGTQRGYIENGVGITTKLDLSNFLAFADTIPSMIINSAELVIDGVETNDLTPPSSLYLRILTEENRFKRRSTDSLERIAEDRVRFLYNNLTSPSFEVISDAGPLSGQQFPPVILGYSSTNTSYNGFMTLFLQELYEKEEGKPVYSNLALYSGNPDPGKTVNRVTFDGTLKLRIYYTRPIND